MDGLDANEMFLLEQNRMFLSILLKVTAVKRVRVYYL